MSNKNPKLTAIPASRSKLPILKVRLALVLSILLFSSAMGVVSTVAWFVNKPAKVQSETPVPYGKGLAELAVISWLDGRELGGNKFDSFQIKNSKPLTHGPVVWDGFIRKTLPPPSNLVYENHKFITTIPMANDEGATVMTPIYVIVAVAFPGTAEPYVASMPSLRRVSEALSSAVFDYSDLPQENLPSSAVKQVTSWAEAFASDNRDQLKLLTGDTTPGYQFMGLGGFKAQDVSIKSSIYSGNTAYGNDTWLVRVRFTLVSANLFNQDTEMDLTIVDGSSGLPKIAGYGPAGAGLRSSSDTRVKL